MGKGKKGLERGYGGTHVLTATFRGQGRNDIRSDQGHNQSDTATAVA